MVVCVECLPADKPWNVVSATRRSSGVAPRPCVCVYARVLVPANLYIHTYILSVALSSEPPLRYLSMAMPLSVVASVSASRGAPLRVNPPDIEGA